MVRPFLALGLARKIMDPWKDLFIALMTLVLTVDMAITGWIIRELMDLRANRKWIEEKLRDIEQRLNYNRKHE